MRGEAGERSQITKLMTPAAEREHATTMGGQRTFLFFIVSSNVVATPAGIDIPFGALFFFHSLFCLTLGRFAQPISGVFFCELSSPCSLPAGRGTGGLDGRRMAFFSFKKLALGLKVGVVQPDRI